MQRLFGNKRWTIVISTLSLLALSGLAIGLRDVSFRPGLVTGRRETATIQLAFMKVVGRIEDIRLWEHLLVWIVLILGVLLIGLLMTPEGRRRLIQSFIRFAAIFWAIYFIMKYNGDLLAQLAFGFQIPAASGAGSAPAAPLPAFEPPQLPAAVIFVLSLSLAGLLVLLFVGLNRWWTRRQAILRAARPLGEVAGIARASLADLSAGVDPENVIVDCYTRMSHALQERRGLFRQEAMTPSEFAARLERAGLPGEAVRSLTNLFEGVRYGAHRSSRSDVNQAVDCLNAILRSCGELA